MHKSKSVRLLAVLLAMLMLTALVSVTVLAEGGSSAGDGSSASGVEDEAGSGPEDGSAGSSSGAREEPESGSSGSSSASDAPGGGSSPGGSSEGDSSSGAASGADDGAGSSSSGAPSGSDAPQSSASSGEAVVLAAFAPLAGNVARQSFTAFTGAEGEAEPAPVLPATLAATTAAGEDVEVSVTWAASPAFSATAQGTYSFTPTLAKGYTPAEGVSLPGGCPCHADDDYRPSHRGWPCVPGNRLPPGEAGGL